MNCLFCHSELKDFSVVICPTCPIKLVYCINDANDYWYFWNFHGEYFVQVHPGNHLLIAASTNNPNKKDIIFRGDNPDLNPETVGPFLDRILSMRAFL